VLEAVSMVGRADPVHDASQTSRARDVFRTGFVTLCTRIEHMTRDTRPSRSPRVTCTSSSTGSRMDRGIGDRRQENLRQAGGREVPSTERPRVKLHG